MCKLFEKEFDKIDGEIIKCDVLKASKLLNLGKICQGKMTLFILSSLFMLLYILSLSITHSALSEAGV